jgi:DNA-binding response OmpR family regulator
MYRRVLIVEDEIALRQVIGINLQRRGRLVREAATAKEAVSAVLEEQPDLMVLDLNLPDRSGWDVLRELRSQGIEVPTIVVSAVRVGPERLAEFKPLAYLPKPFPLEALLHLIIAPDVPPQSQETPDG